MCMYKKSWCLCSFHIIYCHRHMKPSELLEIYSKDWISIQCSCNLVTLLHLRYFHSEKAQYLLPTVAKTLVAQFHLTSSWISSENLSLLC